MRNESSGIIRVRLKRENTGSTITIDLDQDEFPGDEDIERYIAMRMIGWKIIDIEHLIY